VTAGTGGAGAAIAKVQLDRMRRSATIYFSNNHEVERESADHVERDETLGRDGCIPADRPRVCRIGGEHATQIALSAGSAKQLIVRGQELDLSMRGIRSWTLGLRTSADDPLFDDATVREFRQINLAGTSGDSS